MDRGNNVRVWDEGKRQFFTADYATKVAWVEANPEANALIHIALNYGYTPETILNLSPKTIEYLLTGLVYTGKLSIIKK